MTIAWESRITNEDFPDSGRKAPRTRWHWMRNFGLLAHVLTSECEEQGQKGIKEDDVHNCRLPTHTPEQPSLDIPHILDLKPHTHKDLSFCILSTSWDSFLGGREAQAPIFTTWGMKSSGRVKTGQVLGTTRYGLFQG